jgi:ferric-dicitrate binding protein FerR (iron transport regulator)
MESRNMNDIKNEIKELLSGELTPEKRQKYLELKAVQQKMLTQWNNVKEEPSHNITKRRIWNRIESECFDTRKMLLLRKYWIGISVCIAILIFVAGFWLVPMHKSERFIEVTAQQSRLYILPDSSKVWMQRGSHIRYSARFSENRQVWLKGNSFFDVCHKLNNQSFKVYLNNAYIEVKGTCFLVRQTEASRTEVTLLNGRIELHLAKSNRKIVMHPSEKVLFNPTTGLGELAQTPGVTFNDGRYRFTDVPLSRLVKFINQLSDTTVSLGEGVPTDELFSGSIGLNESVDDFAENICFTMDLQSTKKDNSIIIKLHK